ncbi:hypothetical protein GCM10009548_73360 [Streptomyces malaysiensis subsp. malaysiensis]
MPERAILASSAGAGVPCGLPVVGKHVKHVGKGPHGRTGQWIYQTDAPLDLRPDDTSSRPVTGRGLFWGPTEKGLLPILPQRNALGCNLGYSGGGLHAPAAQLTQVTDSDGQNTAVGAPCEQAHPAILTRTRSSATDRGRNELTPGDLNAMPSRSASSATVRVSPDCAAVPGVSARGRWVWACPRPDVNTGPILSTISPSLRRARFQHSQGDFHGVRLDPHHHQRRSAPGRVL